jgi:hypothetical protein
MPKFYGELQEASLENLASDPSSNVAGRVWRNTTENRIKTDDGTIKRALLRNDDKLAIGNSGTANENVRLNRASASVLQLLQGGNVTPEGTLSASALAQLSSRLENYTDAGKPAPGNPGRLIFVTDLLEVQYDNGATWLSIAGSSGGFGALGVLVVNTNLVLTSGDNRRILMLDSSGGSFNVELPTPAANFLLTVKDFLGELENFPVTLTRPNPAVKIEGLAADYELRAAWGNWSLFSDGTNYYFA